MDGDTIAVNMLGRFSIAWHGQSIDDDDNRSRKAWLLLAYVLFHRSRRVSQEELLRVLWEGEGKSVSPLGALKTLLHRVRTMLNALGEDAGYQILLFKEGCYSINPEIPITCDIEEFERLTKLAVDATGDEKRLALYSQALELYEGDFLPKLSMEHWTIPIEAFFHELFLQTVTETSEIMVKLQRYEDTAELCRKALVVEPYSEDIYLSLLKSLLAIGDKDGVISTYDKLSRQLYETFGTLPTKEATAVYREASSSVNDHAVHSGVLREQLREEAAERGALVCDYDMLKTLYQVQARQIARSGDIYHVAMFTLNSWDNSALSRRSVNIAMDNLQEVLRLNLRTGDVIARCSSVQFVVILPQANYESSCMVCSRLVKLFSRQYPHSPARVDFSVQPLDPNTL